MKIVKKYRYAVIKAQSFVRSFLAIQHARIIVIVKYADSLENQWKGALKKSSIKSVEDLKTEEKKKVGNKKVSVRKDKRDFAVTIPTYFMIF